MESPSISRQSSSNSASAITWKVGIVGEVATGKTSLLLQYTDNTFSKEQIITIGVDYKTKTISIPDKTVTLQLYDTQGHERFRSMTASYYRGAHAVVVVFSVTDRSSFEKLDEWIHNVRFSSKTTQIVLVGNKIDLKSERKVSNQEAEDYARSRKVRYFETSALSGSGINEVFVEVANQISANYSKSSSDYSNSVNVKKKKKSKTNSTCTLL